MRKNFLEKIYNQIVDVKNGRAIFSDSQRDEILYHAKRVRAKDYIIPITIKESNQYYQNAVTTTANWEFVLTGISAFPYVEPFGVYEKWLVPYDVSINPELGLTFENFYPSTPFGSEAEKMNMIKTPFTMKAREKEFGMFNGEKDLFYYLGERITIKATLKTPISYPCKYAVVLTGLEINLQDEGVD